MKNSNSPLLSESQIQELRNEFSRTSFRNYLDDNFPDECCNCGSKDNLTYHHIVPLSLGGRNKLSNIAKLCPICHEKAHLDFNNLKNIGVFKAIKNNSIGRKKLVILDNNSEEILRKYYNLEIGTYEAKTLLGISTNTKSTWYNLRTAYEDKYKIPEGFHNNIDLKNSQTRRKESLKKSKFRFNYDDEIENILHEYFNCKIGAKEAKQRIGLSTKTTDTWYRLINTYKEKFNIPDEFKNSIDRDNIQEQRIKTTKQNILNKKLKEFNNHK